MKKSKNILRIVALILTVAIIIAAVGVQSAFVGGASSYSYWDGVTLTAPNNLGNGSYTISNAAQLAYVIKNGGGEGKTYTLTNDIYLNNLDKVNWTDGTVADGYTANKWYQGNEVSEFTGTLDGNGYIVYGLYYNSTKEIYNCGAGLIPKMGVAKITNIGVKTSYIGFNDTYYGAAALVGRTAQTAEGSISCCFVGDDVTVNGYDVGAIAGGGGPLGEVIIENCYSLATLIGIRKIGVFTSNSFGLMEDNSPKFKVINCYGLGKDTDSTWQSPRFTNVYATEAGASAKVVTEEDLKGAAAADTLVNFDFENIWITTDSYPELRIFNKSYYWNGILEEPVDLGDGNYEISSASQLAYVIKNGGEGNTYTLTNDIYLNDLSKVDWTNGTVTDNYAVNTWYQGNEVPAFTGTLDGNGHIVYGLYYNSTKEIYNCGAGLIPEMGKATIKNIGIMTSYIGFADTYCGAAALVGKTAQTAEGIISCSFVGFDVTVNGYDVGSIAGGANPAGAVIIENCYSLATLIGSNSSGAFTSNSWGLLKDNTPKFQISNSYCLDKGTGSTWQAPKFTNVYATVAGGATKVVTEDALKGAAAADTLVNFDFENIWITTNSYPELKVFNKYDYWDGTVEEPTDLGDGKYEISTPEQLAYVIKNGGGEGKVFTLTTDIYLNNLSKINWATGEANSGYTPNTWFTSSQVSSVFAGTFDGNGHSVFGLYYYGDSEKLSYLLGAGLFPIMGKATIKNVGVETSYIKFYDEYFAVGALVGRAHNSGDGMISQCYVGEDVTVIGYNVSSIISGGIPSGTVHISNCYSLAKLSGTNTVGAIVGNTWDTTKFTVENSYCVNMATSSDWRPPVMTNVYETVKSPKGDTVLVSEDSIKGIGATETLKNLDYDNLWYAVNNENKSPMLRVRGLAIRDVNGNGNGFEEDDFVALRKSVFGTEKNVNTDLNYDETTDICDLVMFDSDATAAASGDKYYSIADLKQANLSHGAIVDLAIKPYSVGQYKIVEDTAYAANGYSVLAVDTGKFAVRYYGEDAVNNWASEELKGNLVAHKSFNGYVDRWTVGEGGTKGTYPENTLEGVEHAVRLGFKVVEIDISVTKDNVWVLNHDANTSSLYTIAESSKSQQLRDVTYDSIKDMPILKQTYYTGGWPSWEFSSDIKKEYIATLESVFESQKDTDLYFILDNKYLDGYTFTDEQMDALAAVIKKYNMEERCAAYAACQVPLSKRLPNIGVAYSAMPSQDEEIAANMIKSHKNYLMSIGNTAGYEGYAPYIEFCNKYDIPIAIWMTDDYLYANEIFEQGADYVLTNSLITAEDLTKCGYITMDTMDSNEIIGNLSFSGDGSNTVTGNTVKLNSNGTYTAAFNLSYSGMGLKAGDVLALTLDSDVLSGNARVKIATDNGVRWYEKNTDGTTTLYYLVNDSYTYDLIATLSVIGGEADFSNIKLTHYRETVRSGLSQ